MTDKTAVDVIYEIYEIVKTQNEKIELLSKQLGLIGNKVNGVLFPAAATLNIPVGRMETMAPLQVKPPAVAAAPAVTLPINVPTASVAPKKNIRAYGHLEDQQGQNLFDVNVVISDGSNNVIKRTKTNKSGNFTAFLPPGTYSVEFSKQGMASEFKVIELKEGQSEVEIA